MTYSISFPNLGICLPHVGKSISIFGLEIAYYGIVIAVAMMAGIYMVLWAAKKTEQNPDDYFDLAMIAIVVSILCARIYYVVFSWDYYKEHLLEILNFRGGGLAIYGGIMGGVATCFVFGKKKKMNYARLMDTACLGLILGQAIGRWGNFFNREAFGGYTDGLLAMRLPVDAIRASEVTEEMMAHKIVENGITYVQMHPTFLYESLWNLAVLLILLVITLKGRKKFHGEIVLSYLLLYGLGRVWIEGLRTDQLLLPGLDLPVSQLLSAVLVIGSGALLLLLGKRQDNRRHNTQDDRGQKHS